ncbi:hypothetical protein EW146_g82 [Bondarzewia mesenterica]|uniref:CNH domain-containing protein n=1 Tax=Bondarzewia mesenterica TaxID=1095465 RepID=A0A4V6S1L8_9AGAM|nr:hypothetical protein EW146_g82 [Bondarzewia mesenterica]
MSVFFSLIVFGFHSYSHFYLDCWQPIPLELLFITHNDDGTNATARPNGRQGKVLTKRSSFNTSASPYPPAIPAKADNSGKGGFSITFVHLGRKYYQMTLWASTHDSQRKWIENISKQQEVMRARSSFFDMETLNEGFFINSINCAAPFNAGQKVVYGTDDGVYLSSLRDQNRDLVKVLALNDVAQVDVLDEYGLLIVLSEGQVITFPLDALDPMNPMSGLKRAEHIASDTSFFKAGICIGRMFVCVVKTSPLSSTIKILEPIDQNMRGRDKPTFRKFLQGGNDNDTLRFLKEFYIPVQSSSIHFPKTQLCVACVNGFEIIDPETLDTQSLLDPSDDSLEFVRHRAENVKPKTMAVYQIENEFLLCYDKYAFYINGWSSRKEFMVHWEELRPVLVMRLSIISSAASHQARLALRYPYVLAFAPTFVEIRNVETGSMSQIIQGNNLGAPAGYGVNPHAQPCQQNSYGGRQSMQSPYGPSDMPLYPQPSPIPPHGSGRDEVIMVSDDHVMVLRMASPG